MVDYDGALVTSKRPEYVLAQAYAHMTGNAIATRFIQSLMKKHTNETILGAIKRMRGKKVSAPIAYLSGICRNLSQDQHTVAKQKLVLANAAASLVEEGVREDRPTIERPF